MAENMKLLGRWEFSTKDKYVELLREKGIEVKEEEVIVSLGVRVVSSHIEFKLYVSEENFNNAYSIIKEIELPPAVELRIKDETKEANRSLILVVIGLLMLIALFCWAPWIQH